MRETVHRPPRTVDQRYLSTPTFLLVVTLAFSVLPRIFVYVAARCSERLAGHAARPEGEASTVNIQPLLKDVLPRDELCYVLLEAKGTSNI